jgi:NDP-sugar pyrophosphorylase family protein
MKSMILAAGLGSRLKPRTDSTPKALINIKRKTLLEIGINNLIKNGFDKIIINVHHHSKQIIQFLNENKFAAEITISDETDKLLDTGGGLKNAKWFFNDNSPFLVYNVDIISNLDLKKLYTFHTNSSAIATLVVRKRESGRYLLFNSKNILCGWRNTKTGETKLILSDKLQYEFAFSGIQVIDPKIFSLMPDENVFSLIDLYLKVGFKHIISAFIDDESYWLDVGKPENLKAAENILKVID